MVERALSAKQNLRINEFRHQRRWQLSIVGINKLKLHADIKIETCMIYKCDIYIVIKKVEWTP